jgi:phosphoribosylformimino-5-aminoimidazole carboxamide ribotide isomerase
VRLIPALDLRGGRVVRLERGEFARERRYTAEPEQWLERFAAAGARLVHVVDLDGARDGEAVNAAVIERLLRRGVPLQIAGGVRSRGRLEAWLERGAARVVIGSMAVERPDEVAAWLDSRGAERLVLAFDVRRGPAGERCLASRGWTAATAWRLEDALARYAGAGLRHVLATAIERDGTLEGPDLELYREAVASNGAIDWQASGGVRDRFDLEALAAEGVAGAVVGRALLDERLPFSELTRWSRDGSSPAST